MVKLNSPEMTTSTEKQPMPVMWRHVMTVIKDAPTFKKGETVTCFIVKYDHGRYCVFTASFIRIDNYHVFESVEVMHEHFEEQ